MSTQQTNNAVCAYIRHLMLYEHTADK